MIIAFMIDNYVPNTLLLPFFRQENCGLKTLTDLPNSTQLVSGGVGMGTLVCVIEDPSTFWFSSLAPLYLALAEFLAFSRGLRKCLLVNNSRMSILLPNCSFLCLLTLMQDTSVNCPKATSAQHAQHGVNHLLHLNVPPSQWFHFSSSTTTLQHPSSQSDSPVVLTTPQHPHPALHSSIPNLIPSLIAFLFEAILDVHLPTSLKTPWPRLSWPAQMTSTASGSALIHALEDTSPLSFSDAWPHTFPKS